MYNSVRLLAAAFRAHRSSGGVAFIRDPPHRSLWPLNPFIWFTGTPFQWHSHILVHWYGRNWTINSCRSLLTFSPCGITYRPFSVFRHVRFSPSDWKIGPPASGALCRSARQRDSGFLPSAAVLQPFLVLAIAVRCLFGGRLWGRLPVILTAFLRPDWIFLTGHFQTLWCLCCSTLRCILY